MRDVFGRLGVVGASLLASAVIFGAIAGGVVVHRLESAPAASTTQRDHNSDEQGGGADEQGDAPSKQKPPIHPAHPAHPSPEPDDSQDKDP